MDHHWRWRSMGMKGAARVAGSELVFAILNLDHASEVGGGLEMLVEKWGAEALAEAMGAPAGEKLLTGGVGTGREIKTVLGQVIEDQETMAGSGGRHPSWGKVGAMLDFGARPGDCPEGCVSAMDTGLRIAQRAGPSDKESCLELVAMLAERAEQASEGSWIEAKCAEFPVCAPVLGIEWAKRQKLAIEISAAQGRPAMGALGRL